jgi:hypothetical protein
MPLKGHPEIRVNKTTKCTEITEKHKKYSLCPLCSLCSLWFSYITNAVLGLFT